MPQRESCAYVTHNWGVHDQRWVVALEETGFAVETFSLTRDRLTPTELRVVLDRGEGSILAGPLDSVTKELTGLSRPLVGLSWGFDLINMQTSGADLSWLRLLDGLIVDSDATRDIAMRSGLQPDRIHQIPWGIDIDAFSPDGARADARDWGVPAGAKMIVSLRALEQIYRVVDIIDAFALIAAELPDTHLVVGNDGTLRDELTERAASHGLSHRTHFIGMLPESELAPLLREASVYVTASEVDGTSVTLLQAMACGTPLVASDTPGNAQWVLPGQTGSLFQTHSAESLAQELRLVLASPADTHQTVAARAAVVEHADWHRNSRKLATIMRPTPRGPDERQPSSF